MKPDNQARDFRKHMGSSGVAPEDYVEMKCFVDLFEAMPSLKLRGSCLTTSAPLILSSASRKPILQAHGRHACHAQKRSRKHMKHKHETIA